MQIQDTTSKHLQSLTPLRGIAAVWVVVYHYSCQYLPNLHPEAYTHLVGKGYLAVDMFFMLSGFLLTHVYHRVFSDFTFSEYWGFLKAGIARLYPLHLTAACLGTWACQHASSRKARGSVPDHS